MCRYEYATHICGCRLLHFQALCPKARAKANTWCTTPQAPTDENDKHFDFCCSNACCARMLDQAREGRLPEDGGSEAPRDADKLCDQRREREKEAERDASVHLKCRGKQKTQHKARRYCDHPWLGGRDRGERTCMCERDVGVMPLSAVDADGNVGTISSGRVGRG